MMHKSYGFFGLPRHFSFFFLYNSVNYIWWSYKSPHCEDAYREAFPDAT